MLFYLTFRVVSSVAAFIYPGYASYKILSQRPAPEEELERWLMYWSVLGCIVGVEYVAEWLVSWLPFYYPIKTIFLLYLALPQTKGSSYLYIHHLQPLFHQHERQIDATLASVRTRIYTFLQAQLRSLWEHVAGQQQAPPRAQGAAGRTTGAPPSLGDPVSGPASMASSFWTWYGPSILASGAALLRQGTAASADSSDRALDEPPVSTSSRTNSGNNTSNTESVLERRRRLEAELASLSESQAQPYDVNPPSGSAPSTLTPPASSSSTYQRSRNSSESSLRDRSGGRFEEVDVPSDAEAYEQGHAYDSGSASGERRQPPPPAQKRTSWFWGWGSGGDGQGSYERVKTD